MKNCGMQQWQCVNRDCSSTETLTLPQSLAAPRCGCGAAMERANTAVVFSYLDFLREEEQQAEEYPANKE
jgi:hypothetical protein